jgi:hypothetical protein
MPQLILPFKDFRVVFEYGILLLSDQKKGISMLMLFKKIWLNNHTPFSMDCDRYGHDMACDRQGRDIVMKVIEDTLLDFQRHSDDDDDDGNNSNNNNNNSNNTGPYNVVDALITAAINETIHLDCVYFLFRREPDILVKLLSSSSTMIDETSESNDNDGGDDIIIGSSGSSNTNNNKNNKEDIKDGRKRSSDNDFNSVNGDLMIDTNPKKRKR